MLDCTGMDTARSALRGGAEQGLLVCGRGVNGTNPRVEEHKHVIEGGADIHWLTNPVETRGTERARESPRLT